MNCHTDSCVIRVTCMKQLSLSVVYCKFTTFNIQTTHTVSIHPKTLSPKVNTLYIHHKDTTYQTG